MDRQYKFFTFKELSCPCCGRSHMDDLFMKKIIHAREQAGIPFEVTSAYRCDEHNKNVGGVKNSSHTKGFAIDLQAVDSTSRFVIVQSLMEAGLDRIGISKKDGFIHVDMDPSKQKKLVWLY